MTVATCTYKCPLLTLEGTSLRMQWDASLTSPFNECPVPVGYNRHSAVPHHRRGLAGTVIYVSRKQLKVQLAIVSGLLARLVLNAEDGAGPGRAVPLFVPACNKW